MKRVFFFLGLFIFQTGQAVAGNLKQYRARRNVTKSGEPTGVKNKKTTKRPIFVIQKHAARSLHYDVRLEVDGVLVSWAVPKGPSLNPAVKRLAVRTDDHPMDYAAFEGIIPPGNYGAGTVIVWDRGTYTNVKEEYGLSMEECLRDGRIEVFLRGKKLKGAFALVKTSKDWLMIKVRDEYAHARRNPVSTQQKSVKSGRTLSAVKLKGRKKNDSI